MINGPPKILGETHRFSMHPNNMTNTAPHICNSRTCKKQMMYRFILIAESTRVVAHPFAYFHIIFSRNCVVPGKSQPYLDFERNLSLPQILKGCVWAKTRQMCIYGFHSEFTRFSKISIEEYLYSLVLNKFHREFTGPSFGLPARSVSSAPSRRPMCLIRTWEVLKI